MTEQPSTERDDLLYWLDNAVTGSDRDALETAARAVVARCAELERERDGVREVRDHYIAEHAKTQSERDAARVAVTATAQNCTGLATQLDAARVDATRLREALASIQFSDWAIRASGREEHVCPECDEPVTHKPRCAVGMALSATADTGAWLAAKIAEAIRERDAVEQGKRDALVPKLREGS